MASQDRKKNDRGANPPVTIPVVPDVSRHRMAMLLYRGYREWVAAGKPKRA